MRYRVRTPDGELGYPSLEDVARAYAQGLVDPEDEVLEEGGTTWRKASSLSAVARARRASQGLAGRTQALSVALATVLGLSALFLIAQESWNQRLLGIVLALLVALGLSRVTYKAFRRPGPSA